jgi:molybdopterin/thiamine biosynthesis adenylyltransferase
VVKPSDLNRQLLMTHTAIGASRVERASRRLRELNPHVAVVTIPENVGPGNAARMVGMADVVACCAPLFEERFALNQQCVRQGKPMVGAAMYELTGSSRQSSRGRPRVWRAEIAGAAAGLEARVPGVRSGSGDGRLPGGEGGDQADHGNRRAAGRAAFGV